jgi:hypothetical protein
MSSFFRTCACYFFDISIRVLASAVRVSVFTMAFFLPAVPHQMIHCIYTYTPTYTLILIHTIVYFIDFKMIFNESNALTDADATRAVPIFHPLSASPLLPLVPFVSLFVPRFLLSEQSHFPHYTSSGISRSEPGTHGCDDSLEGAMILEHSSIQ